MIDSEEPDFFNLYFQTFADTEPPDNYHRWCALSGVAALLGRQTWVKFGAEKIYPNMYVFLIGNPGSRKSTAIKAVRRLVLETGYETITADKSSKEKFLLDLYQNTIQSNAPVEKANGHDYLDTGEFSDEDREAFIVAADDFSDFIGSGNFDFISLLSNLWDYTGIYRARVKNSKSVAIPNPTINILSGNTPTSFASAFPPEAIGQGFMSRSILIFGESSGKQITIPTVSEKTSLELVARLHKIKTEVLGEKEVSEEAFSALSVLYKKWNPLADMRLASYSTRRFTHLLKLSLLICATYLGKRLELEHIVSANTILSAAERNMAKALGEFGKGKFSDATQKLMEALYETSPDAPLNLKDLYKKVKNDVDKFQDLSQILTNLTRAEKIIPVKIGDKVGWLPARKVDNEGTTDFLDFSLLTVQERRSM